jgi:hypothetical protein
MEFPEEVGYECPVLPQMVCLPEEDDLVPSEEVDHLAGNR